MRANTANERWGGDTSAKDRPVRGAAPDVASILDVDREYRAAVVSAGVGDSLQGLSGSGRNVALPVLRTRRREWNFTATYSSSDACHALHRDRDWVVVRYDDGAGNRGGVTVVTGMRGPFRGRRILRSAETLPAPGCTVGGDSTAVADLREGAARPERAATAA